MARFPARRHLPGLPTSEGTQATAPWTVSSWIYPTGVAYEVYGTYIPGAKQIVYGLIYNNLDNDNPYLPNFLQLNDNGTLSIYPGANGASGGAIVTRGTYTPVTAIKVSSLTYDTADTTYNSLYPILAATSINTNNTPSPPTQTVPISLAFSYTDTSTYTWNTTQTISTTISSSTKIGVSGIGDTTGSVAITGSTSISQGQSTASTRYQDVHPGRQVVIPTGHTYKTTLTAYEQDASIPYTYTGTAYYANGYTSPITGTGVYEGVSTGLFQVSIDCVALADQCSTADIEPPTLTGSSTVIDSLGGILVPEPPSAVTMLPALCALLTLVIVRRNGKRRRSPGPAQAAA